MLPIRAGCNASPTSRLSHGARRLGSRRSCSTGDTDRPGIDHREGWRAFAQGESALRTALMAPRPGGRGQLVTLMEHLKRSAPGAGLANVA